MKEYTILKKGKNWDYVAKYTKNKWRTNDNEYINLFWVLSDSNLLIYYYYYILFSNGSISIQ
jgi:hypothetical protein